MIEYPHLDYYVSMPYKLTFSPLSYDVSGYSVELSNNGLILAVGEPSVSHSGESTDPSEKSLFFKPPAYIISLFANEGDRAGRVRIFRYENSDWSLLGNSIEGGAGAK